MNDKCDNCIRWKFFCELSGNSRKACLSQDYKFYKPKKVKD